MAGGEQVCEGVQGRVESKPRRAGARALRLPTPAGQGSKALTSAQCVVLRWRQGVWRQLPCDARRSEATAAGEAAGGGASAGASTGGTRASRRWPLPRALSFAAVLGGPHA